MVTDRDSFVALLMLDDIKERTVTIMDEGQVYKDINVGEAMSTAASALMLKNNTRKQVKDFLMTDLDKTAIADSAADLLRYLLDNFLTHDDREEVAAYLEKLNKEAEVCDTKSIVQ